MKHPLLWWRVFVKKTGPELNNRQFSNSNVNYIGKDFNDLKSSLINYAKSYFPNTYKDFIKILQI